MCYLNATCRPTGQDDIEALRETHSVEQQNDTYISQSRNTTPQIHPALTVTPCHATTNSTELTGNVMSHKPNGTYNNSPTTC